MKIDEIVDDFSQGKIEEKSEIQGAAEVLFEDQFDARTKLSSIDLRTRLSDSQIPNIAICDEFSKLGVIPDANSFTRNIKRLNVSIDGKGRQELVQIASGVLQQQQGMGMWDRFKGFFQPQQK